MKYRTNNLKLCAYLMTMGATLVNSEVQQDVYFRGELSVHHTFEHPGINKMVTDYRSEPFVRYSREINVLSEKKIGDYQLSNRNKR